MTPTKTQQRGQVELQMNAVGEQKALRIVRMRLLQEIDSCSDQAGHFNPNHIETAQRILLLSQAYHFLQEEK